MAPREIRREALAAPIPMAGEKVVRTSLSNRPALEGGEEVVVLEGHERRVVVMGLLTRMDKMMVGGANQVEEDTEAFVVVVVGDLVVKMRIMRTMESLGVRGSEDMAEGEGGEEVDLIALKMEILEDLGGPEEVVVIMMEMATEILEGLVGVMEIEDPEEAVEMETKILEVRPEPKV